MSPEPDTLTAHSPITDHPSRSVALLMGALRSKSRVAALASAHGARVQQLEDALWSVLALTLENATGDALKQYGELVQVPRGGLPDDSTYRAVLRAAVRARRSSGTGPDLIAVVALAVDGITFSLTHGGASLCVELDAPLAWDPQALADLLELAVGAGIGSCVVAPADLIGDALTFASNALLAEASIPQGFNDAYGTADGGQLAGAYS